MPLRRVHLHSSDTHTRWNFAGGEPDAHVLFHRGIGHASEGNQLAELFDDPLALLNWMTIHRRDGFRWVGYLSYGLGRYIERLPSKAVDDLDLPLLAFARFKADSLSVAHPTLAATGTPTIRERTSKSDYQKTVSRVIEYIGAGDVFQVNLAQRLDIKTSEAPEAVWQRLVERYPSHFGALLQFDDFSILSNSPELFFRVEPLANGTRRIINRPIKGTRPKKPGMLEELIRSQKDIAELAMIVDLQRNDLGRVCEIGSVKVTNAREIEAHPTVYHGVATIEGRVRKDADLADIIRAVFPCGSITGCPKIRAMEIIDELEPLERGPYCGAIGYIDFDGHMEFNVAIRTMTMKQGIASVCVGGGIVADSTPPGEYDETLVKATALLDVLGIDPVALRNG